MPMKLNVGLSKKVGLPDYGSMGASCHVELELDGALLQSDLDRFHQHVQRAFVACRQAVQDELARHGSSSEGGHVASQTANSANSHAHGQNRERRQPQGARENGAARNNRDARASKQVTPKQIRYCTEMAGRIEGLGTGRLAQMTQQMYGKPLRQLSTLEASNLIATLKDMEAGKIDPQAVFGGAAA